MLFANIWLGFRNGSFPLDVAYILLGFTWGLVSIRFCKHLAWVSGGSFPLGLQTFWLGFTEGSFPLDFADIWLLQRARFH